MLFKNGQNSKILLTTPDFPPKLGGLSTFSQNIESSLKELGLDFDIFVWENLKELQEFSSSKLYEHAFHIHFFGHHYLKKISKSHVNFIHGSEILFTSPNLIKKIYKKLTKPFFLKTLMKASHNVFISDFTFNKLQSLGLKASYDRDIIFHNCINVEKSDRLIKDFDQGVFRFISVARDVPHENLESLLDIAKAVALETGKNIELYCSKELPSNELVKCIDISGVDDKERDELLSQAHFNLLLSLEHSDKGFYEGFGLTVLEAGRFATPSIVSPYGGLPEAVHHNHTGWVIEPNANGFKRFFKHLTKEGYKRVSNLAFDHTLSSHDRGLYNKLLAKVLGSPFEHSLGAE